MHPDGIAAAKACRIPGCCIFCETPLPKAYKTNPRTTLCGSADCEQAYMRAYMRDYPRHPRYANKRRAA